MESSRHKQGHGRITDASSRSAGELEVARKYDEAILETIREPLIVLDANLKVLFANNSFYKTFLVKPEETEGKLVYDLGTRQWDIPKLRELLEEILPKNPRFSDFEVECEFPRLGRKRMLLNARRMNDEGQKTQKILLAIRDITVRKQLEYEIASSELRYRRLFETARDGILILDAETGQITDVNPFLIDMLGYTKKEFLGKKLWEISPFKDTKAGQTAFLKAQTKGYIRYSNLPLETKDGESIGVEFVSNIYLVNGRKVIQCDLRNITERHRAEKVLQNEGNQLISILDNMEDGVIIVNQNYDIEYINSTIEKEFGPAEGCKCYTYLNDREGVCPWCKNKEVLTGKTLRREWHSFKNDKIYDLIDKPLKNPGGITSKLVIFRDITDRKQVEEEARLNKTRLESLLRISKYRPEDVREFLDYALDEAIKLTGSKIGYIYFYDEEMRQFTLNTWSREVMKECAIINRQTIYQLDKTGVWGEVVRQRKPIILNDYGAPNPLKKGYPDGHASLYRWMSIPVFSRDKIVAVIGVANKDTDYEQNDIHQLTLLMSSVWTYAEYQNIEAALRQSEDRLKRSQKIAHLGSWELDLVNNCLTWSDEVYRIFGLKPQEYGVTYETFLEAVHPDDRSTVDSAYSRSLEEGSDFYDIEHRIIRKFTGEVRYVHEKCQHIKDAAGKIIRSIGMIHDITERKKAGEALLASEKRSRSFIELTGELGWVTNADGEVAEDIPSFRRYTGQTYNDVKGWGWSKALHPDDIEITKETWSKAVKEKTRYEMEYRLRRYDGEYRYFLARGFPVFAQDGVVIEWVGTCIDISERKTLEALKDEFIGMISHEIKTPLTVITGALNVAENKGITSDERKELIHDAVMEAEELACMVDNLLELSRYQSSRLDLHRKQARIDPVAQNVVARMQNKSAIHHLVTDIPSELPSVMIDSVRIGRVLNNLVENAIKYSPQGGAVRIFSYHLNEDLIIGVSDEGIGISPENQTKLFEQFQRLGIQDKYSISGIGLGLRVCKILIETHGGRMWVDSEPGKGSTFFFSLPTFDRKQS